MKKIIKLQSLIKICLALFFAICVFGPVISMFLRITPEGFRQMVSSQQFSNAVKNSVLTSLAATFISLLLALTAALCIERSAIHFKSLFSMLFLLPMLIPSISHAFGLISLFGANGYVTNLFGTHNTIYGFWGIVIGAVMYSFPVAFLMFSEILKYEDGMVYDAASILGIPDYRRFFDITLPFIRKTTISAVFAVFTLTITDYGVPLMLGGKTITLSVLMYNKAVASVDYGSGSVIGTFLLLPAVAAFTADILNRDNSQSSFSTIPVVPKEKRTSTLLSYVLCILLCLIILAPIIAFCIMIFETKYPVDPTFTLFHIKKTFNRGAGEYLLNSLLYASLTALFGTILSFVCSYCAARLHGALSRILHLFSVTSMAIPGIVLGLSYVILFHNTFIYGTWFIIVLVNTVHFFASPYLMMYNTLTKLNENLEDVGASLGIRRFFIIKDVIIPKVRYTLFEMFSYFFVNSMMTISAVSFLAPPAGKPLAIMINQFEAQLLMESSAFVSILILVINFVVKSILSFLKKRSETVAYEG